MGRALRAYFGATLGALLVLSLHPSTRAFLWPSYRLTPPPLNGALLEEFQKTLEPPERLSEAALWMRVAGKKRLGQRMLLTELENVVRIARSAAEREPENGFWRQMGAAALWDLGRREEALDEWRRASFALNWNDYQSTLLSRERLNLAGQMRGAQAWQFAAAYRLRAQEPIEWISATGRALLTWVEKQHDPAQTLLQRYYTLANGSLIREHARSIAGGDIGVRMVESVTYPPSETEIGYRRLLLARIEFFDALAADGYPQYAEASRQSLDRNDAWAALMSDRGKRANSQNLILSSVLTAALPCSMLICAAFGAAIWGVGRLFITRSEHLHRFRPVSVALTAALAATGTLLWTRLTIPTLIVLLCFLFLVWSPAHERKRPQRDLGPLFRFVAGFLSIGFSVAFALYLTGISLPAWTVLGHYPWLHAFYGNAALFSGLTCIALAGAVLLAPLWAFAHRQRTSLVLGLALRQFGLAVLFLNLTLGLLAVPIALELDTRIQPSLERLLLNEPVYYLSS